MIVQEDEVARAPRVAHGTRERLCHGVQRPVCGPEPRMCVMSDVMVERSRPLRRWHLLPHPLPSYLYGRCGERGRTATKLTDCTLSIHSPIHKNRRPRHHNAYDGRRWCVAFGRCLATTCARHPVLLERATSRPALRQIAHLARCFVPAACHPVVPWPYCQGGANDVGCAATGGCSRRAA